MARLPIVGGDVGNWGNVLNDYLDVEHAADGTLRIRTDGTLDGLYTKPAAGIPRVDLGSGVQTSLSKADSAVQSVAGQTGPTVVLAVTDLDDTAVSSPTDGEVLTFDAGTSTWTNQAAPQSMLPVMLPAFSRVGVLTVTAGKSGLPIDGWYQLVGVFARVNTAPAGADLILDVRKNGTSIYTTTANRPTIADGSNSTGPGATPDVATLAAGDFLTVDIVQVGSATAGADLVVTISAQRSA